MDFDVVAWAFLGLSSIRFAGKAARRIKNKDRHEFEVITRHPEEGAGNREFNQLLKTVSRYGPIKRKGRPGNKGFVVFIAKRENLQRLVLPRKRFLDESGSANAEEDKKLHSFDRLLAARSLFDAA